ncbi:MAG TPA: histidine kinase, partial [Anaerolineae bacterium]|nr:histidine kinase [Anaerolineae bacterium]
MKAPSHYFDPAEFTEDSDATRPYNLKSRMVRGVNKLPLPRRIHRLGLRVASYFHRLQWKLTFAYTLFTAGTILILAVVALALLWYLNFQSNLYPNAIADAMSKGVPPLADFLEQDPPDQAGLQRWLDDAIAANYLIINVPKDETGNDAETQVPGLFGEVELAAIVDANGKVLAVSADEAIALNEALHGHLSPQAATVFEAALRGESDLTQLATRGDGSLTAAVPILGHDNQVVGAMLFTTHAFPISESEFLQKVLQQMILPFAGIMLVVGVVVGALFGFLIARGLTRRLRNLSEAADAWSEGNFQVLAQDNAGDELSRLAGHLNHMAIQLQNLLQTRQELAGLEERNRLARELHDSVKQQVFATAMQVGAAKALIDRQPDQVKPHLQEAEQLVREAQQELTTLILELRPAALEGQGLAKALNHYVADWSRQTKVKADIRISGERLLPLPTEQTLFR